ncbi:MAG: 2OG-Fe(II) oxygenase family protein [Lysobacterales bacterium]
MSQSPLAETRVLPLFPTYVWYATLADSACEPINKQILERLGAMQSKSDRSRQLLQTGQDMHLDPALSGLLPFIDGAARGALDFMKIRYSGFSITGCWANQSESGLGHKPHCHPNNFLSGVYYVAVPKGGDSITFHDPRPQPNVFMPPTTELTNDNAGTMTIGVKTGTLVVFPSWLHHSVEPNQANATRTSIAFNIMFDDFAQDISPPMWQGNLA